MSGRDTLLITHGSLHPALRRELAARGLRLRESPSWREADRSQPERILGAYTWFYEGLRHPLQVWRMHRWLQRRGIPLFVWNQDAPHYLNYTQPNRAWRLWLAQEFSLYDIYATHTLIDESRDFADLTVYFPNAADINAYNLHGETDTVFKRLRDPRQYRWDVTFFGGMNGSRYKEDRARERFFAGLSRRLDTLGISHCFRETAGMTVKEQIEFIQSSRINLNYGARCEHGFSVASGLPERCYGIPAAGGFILCDMRTHAKDDFTVGKNWAEFVDIDDCVTQIRYWLGHFNDLRDLAERCHKHVLANHTYTHRATKLHQALQAWHKGYRGLIL
jgi:spore maturation protein CgeB